MSQTLHYLMYVCYIMPQFSINGRPNIKAHRFSYERHRGPVPDGLSVLHKCDVRCCVNPAHLYVGTAADNGRDAVVRGRSCFGTNNARARITEREVPAIRAATDHPRILGRQYGIAESTVRAIQKRKIWAWVP